MNNILMTFKAGRQNSIPQICIRVWKTTITDNILKSLEFQKATHTCAFCFCLGVSRSFASDTSPNWIDRQGLGKGLQGLRKISSRFVNSRTSMCKQASHPNNGVKYPSATGYNRFISRLPYQVESLTQLFGWMGLDVIHLFKDCWTSDFFVQLIGNDCSFGIRYCFDLYILSRIFFFRVPDTLSSTRDPKFVCTSWLSGGSWSTNTLQHLILAQPWKVSSRYICRIFFEGRTERRLRKRVLEPWVF